MGLKVRWFLLREWCYSGQYVSMFMSVFVHVSVYKCLCSSPSVCACLVACVLFHDVCIVYCLSLFVFTSVLVSGLYWCLFSPLSEFMSVLATVCFKQCVFMSVCLLYVFIDCVQLFVHICVGLLFVIVPVFTSVSVHFCVGFHVCVDLLSVVMSTFASQCSFCAGLCLHVFVQLYPYLCWSLLLLRVHH